MGTGRGIPPTTPEDLPARFQPNSEEDQTAPASQGRATNMPLEPEHPAFLPNPAHVDQKVLFSLQQGRKCRIRASYWPSSLGQPGPPRALPPEWGSGRQTCRQAPVRGQLPVSNLR